MYYISAISSISHQDSFQNDNIFDSSSPLKQGSEVVQANYKDFIAANALRRLSPILRMSLTAAIDCSNHSQNEFDAISVGTSLGCLKDTQKFLETFINANSSVLSPTPFIQSTHNTIGGQISLGLNNHAYNMTHTQNNLSFEVALLDALMCIDEGKTNVLVGAADEQIDFLKLVQGLLIPKNYELSSGASFFVLNNRKGEASVAIKAVRPIFKASDTKVEMNHFLKNQNVEHEAIGLILHSNSQLGSEFSEIKSVNYLMYTGLHYCASAFAVHMAHDYLISSPKKYALVVNDMCPDNLGLILLFKDEA